MASEVLPCKSRGTNDEHAWRICIRSLSCCGWWRLRWTIFRERGLRKKWFRYNYEGRPGAKTCHGIRVEVHILSMKCDRSLPAEMRHRWECSIGVSSSGNGCHLEGNAASSASSRNTSKHLPTPRYSVLQNCNWFHGILALTYVEILEGVRCEGSSGSSHHRDRVEGGALWNPLWAS